jgi:hypothetical protein
VRRIETVINKPERHRGSCLGSSTFFNTEVRSRLLGPLLEADQPSAPAELRPALRTIEQVLGEYVSNARLGIAA